MPLTTPERFRYRNHTTQLAYRKTPPGSVTIRGSDLVFAYTPTVEDGWSHKALVLADPLLSRYNMDDFAAVLEVLTQLMANHVCYCVHGQRLVLFDLDQAQSPHSPMIQAIQPLPSTVINSHMAALGHEADRVCILDSLALHNAPFPANYGLLQQLIESNANEFVPYFVTRPDESLAIHLIDESDWVWWCSVCERLPQHTFQVRLGSAWAYKRLSLDVSKQARVSALCIDCEDGLPIYNAQAWKNLQRLECLKMPRHFMSLSYFDFDTLARVKHLDLSYPNYRLNLEILKDFLNEMPRLESLDLSCSACPESVLEAKNDDLLAQLNILSCLKRVTLKGWPLNHSFSDRLLRHCTNLERFHGSVISFALGIPQYPLLQSLHLSDCQDEPVPQQWLVHSHKLASLSLHAVSQKTPLNSHLSQLKRLELSNSSLVSAYHLIKTTRQLNHVRLVGIEGALTEGSFIPYMRFLKSCFLQNMNIGPHVFQFLAPSLTHLKSEGCVFPSNNCISLPKLQQLLLEYTTIETLDFVHLLQSTTQLKKLVIDACYFEPLDSFDFSCLRSCQHLTLIQEEGDSDGYEDGSIEALLRHSHSLVFLKLKNHLLYLLSPHLPCWKNLKVLELDTLPLLGHNVSEVLSQCAQLEHLSLTCAFASQEKFFLSHALPCLYYFHYQDENLSVRDIANVLHHMPTLQELVLTFNESNHEVAMASSESIKRLEIRCFGDSAETLSVSLLRQLLLAMPRLEALIIEHFIASPLDLRDIDFSHLTEISTTNAELLTHVLEKASALTSVCRQRCKAILIANAHSVAKIAPRFQSLQASTQPSCIAPPVTNPQLAVRVFFTPYDGAGSIDPSQYRLKVHGRAQLEGQDCYLIPVFQQFSVMDFPSRAITTNNHFADTIPHQRANLVMTFQQAGEMHDLPSLSAQESLIAWHSDTTGLQLWYDRASQRYAISATAPLSTTVSYSLTVPEPQNVACPELDVLIQRYQAYQDRELHGENVADIVSRVGKNGIGGACRFRTAAFLLEVQTLQSEGKLAAHISVREISNDCHSYIEISMDSGRTWHGRHLGGTAAILRYVNPTSQNDRVSPSSICHSHSNGQVVNLPAAISSSSSASHPTTVDVTPAVYAARVKASVHKQLLIEFATDADLMAFQRHYQALYGLDSEEPIFCVHGPEDLSLSPQRLVLIGTDNHANVVISPERCAALLDFKNRHQHQKATIFINWRNFKPLEIPRYNAIIDAQRRFHDDNFPAHFRILSVTTKNHYCGPDLSSRHQYDPQLSVYPCDSSALQQAVAQLYPNPNNDTAQIIDLYDSPEWESLLLGTVTLSESGVTFQHGALLKAQTATAICLRNAPWQNTDFQNFWHHFYRQSTIHVHGQRFAFSDALQLSHREGYEALTVLASGAVWLRHSAPLEAYTLNPTTVRYCYVRYGVKHDRLCQRDGWLAAGSVLDFHVTRSLSLGEWCRLLAEAQRLQCSLRFHVAADVTLPAEFMSHIVWQTPQATPVSPVKAVFMVASDTYAAITALKAQHPQAFIVSTSHFNSHDALMRIDEVTFNTQGISAKFHTSDLWQALKNGHMVIVHGEFNQEQVDYLACFFSPQPHYLFEGERLTYSGVLVCISTEDRYFGFVAAQNRQVFAGVVTPPLVILQPEAPIALCHSMVANANDLDRHRLHIIFSLLQHQPYVLIEGTSLAGKTQLLQKCAAIANIHSHVGMRARQAWLDDQQPGIKLWILDDLRSNEMDWTQLPDFATTPPTYFHQGRHYTLGPNHKLLCSAHSAQVNDLCQQACFARKPARFLLQDLPTWYWQARLEPLFVLLPQQNRQAIRQSFWDTASQHPLSIPVLKQLLLLLNLSLQRRSAQHTWYTDWPMAFNQYHQGCPAVLFSNDHYDAPQMPATTRFVMTPSRYSAYCWLQAMLQLQAFKQRALPPTASELLKNGLNAFLLVGEAGLGKSELLEYLIETAHLLPADRDHPDYRSGIYYTLSPANCEIEVERILLKAFDEGATVIVHELSALAVKESFLKCLLAGDAPDGKVVTKPGFMLWAAQNPISYEGRPLYSQDFSALFIQHTLIEYPAAELRSILSRQCPWLSVIQQNTEINRYQQQRDAARLNPRMQSPTVRGWLRDIHANNPMPNAASVTVLTLTKKYVGDSLPLQTKRHRLFSVC